MRLLKYIVLFIVLSSSCKKEREIGTVIYKINFTTNKIGLKKTRATNDNLYTQFGSYITSLTPSKFLANIWTIGYVDTVFSHSNNNAQMLQYIEQNSEKLSMDDPSRLVDFSGNTTVTFNPVLYGRVNNDGQFEDLQIDFAYFYFMPNYLYQEVQLPLEYKNVQPEMFPSGSAVNNVLKVRHAEMLRKIFPNANINNGLNFFFGNTEHTFVVNPSGELVPTSVNNPISDATRGLIVRSNKYVNKVYNAPPAGKTVVMNGILSIDTKDLIQVYTGADNIPYTKDDIFVYAPNFWERIDSKLEIN